ncbi:hypothetical protein OG765_37680 [Streptomyces sp. NBC_00555]|uniref:hypothetical protein n=1 Tax=Streptomyces sp. NBC_00555 TaxID=2903662 RepID=UPI002257488A|nr:hypothetical protein [Streptomyces sp. NBC_00555]MCX5016655.1 hypothetical protein [Streptomyces sp. NBC_00555]
MVDLVESLVPDELWVLFRRVVPPTQVIRPQGGGRHRAGDSEALGEAILVASTGWAYRSWLAGCRGLHRRYERKAEHFLVFVGVATALIGYRRLTN